MMQSIKLCGKGISDDLAVVALANSKLGMRVTFASSVALNGLAQFFSGTYLVPHRKQYFQTQLKMLVGMWVFYEVLFYFAPSFFSGNWHIYNPSQFAKVEIHLTDVINSNALMIIECLTLCTATVIGTLTSKNFFWMFKVDAMNDRKVLAIVLNVIIFLSGFLVFFYPNFEKIILERSKLCK